MLNKLKNIPLVKEVQLVGKQGAVHMLIDNHRARGYCCSLSLVIALFMDTAENLPTVTLRHITLLLGAHPDIHDYALHLTPEGLWLCSCYDNNLIYEALESEIEKHLALTRYLQITIRQHRELYADGMSADGSENIEA